MSSYLDAAETVLIEVNTPLTAEDLTKLAIDRGLLSSQGVTPSQTMKSKLSTDILQNRASSRFMRTAQNRFALRSWSDRFGEYVAPRHKKALLDEDAVVFDAELLREFGISVGLTPTPLADSWDLISSCRAMPRRQAEETPSVIQLVSGFIVRWQSRYLTYKRSRRLPEARLHHTYSISFGGHLTPRDVHADQLFTVFTPEAGLFALEREFEEELRVKIRPRFEYRGLLYDTSRDVSRQHLAIVYDAWLNSPVYEVGERGFLIDDRLETLEEIEGRIGDFENWSEIIVRDERRRRHA